MSILDAFQKTPTENRLIDEELYAQAMRELQSRQVRDGLWAKALMGSNGDDSYTQALYSSIGCSP